MCQLPVFGFLAVLSAIALYRAQRALWDPKGRSRRGGHSSYYD